VVRVVRPPPRPDRLPGRPARISTSRTLTEFY